ncbi:MAG: hypothetical protein WCI67_18785, partial [Chloroflexales bacterium]
VADVLAQARDDARGKGGEATGAAAFLAELRGELATFAPCGPPASRAAWLPWCGPYLAALWAGETNEAACRLAGVAASTVFTYGRRTPDFTEARAGVREAARAIGEAPRKAA